MTNKWPLLGVVILQAILPACSEKDETPPPAPWVDPIAPTREARIFVTGSAEYGAKVTLRGGQRTVTTTADAHTALFRAAVDLDTTIPVGSTTVTTRLSVTAEDEAGNESAATKVSVVFDPSALPDDDAPAVSVVRVNGFYVCPDGMLTDMADLSDCGARAAPATIFRRGSLVVVTIRARDERALARIAYEAFGTNVDEAQDMLVPGGSYVAGTDLDVQFSFDIGAWAGEILVTGQAEDSVGNIANSRPARLEVIYQLEAGDRQADLVASGPMLSAIRDVAVAPDGTLYASNRDTALPAIYLLDPNNQGIIIHVDYFPDRPEYLAFDAAGNLYASLDNADEVWRTDTTGATGFYNDPGADPEGMDSVAGGVPAAGRFLAQSAIADDRCLSIATGPSTRHIVMVTTTACAATCAGGGNLAGLAPNACVVFSAGGLSALEQAGEIAAALNAASPTTGMSAFAADDCGNTTAGPGNGDPCLYLVANERGTTPAPTNGQPVTLESSDGNWTASNVQSGADADTLYVVDRGNDRVVEVQTAPAAGSGTLRNLSFNNGGWVSGNLVDVAAAMRRRAGESASLAQRLFLYTSDDNGQVIAYDAAANHTWILADTNDSFPHVAGGNAVDRLDDARGIVYVPPGGGGGDCLLVANRSPASVLLRGEILAYTDLDDSTGQPVRPENDLPMVTGFASIRGLALDATDANPNDWSLLVVDDSSQIIMRIGRSASTTDCF